MPTHVKTRALTLFTVMQELDKYRAATLRQQVKESAAVTQKKVAKV
jgi:hypothetical protein